MEFIGGVAKKYLHVIEFFYYDSYWAIINLCRIYMASFVESVAPDRN